MSELPRPSADRLPHPPRAVLDDRWRQWVAENRLLDSPPASMIAAMVAAGLDRGQCERAVAAVESDPIFRAARRHQQLQRKLESVLANHQTLWESDPDYAVVERRDSVPRNEFIERYVRGCRPLVLTGLAADWPALHRWRPENLKARFGDQMVEVQAERSADPNFEENKLLHRKTVRLGDFVDRVLAGGATNDYYLTANNEALRRPGLRPLLDDVGTLPDYCVRAELAQRAFFWFGPGGTNTPLHHDTVQLLHTQVVGRKRWRFISPLQTPRVYNHHGVFSPIDVERPDLQRYPRFAGVRILETVVGPGETVFLPLGWWHQVSALDVSVSLSFSNLAVPNDFRYDNPDIRDW